MADPERTRRVDPITLTAGLAALAVSGYVLSDGPAWWPDIDLRWILAGAAVLVGLVLLGSSLRRTD